MSRNLDHLVVSGYVTAESYTSPITGRDRVIPTTRNRNNHGRSIQDQFGEAVSSFREELDVDYVYLEFISEIDCLLAFDSLEDGRSGDYRFISSKIEKITIDEEEHIRYKACVYLNTKGISKFLNKVEAYLKRNSGSGNPRHQKLINNIASIQKATLESFWQEKEIPFPNYDQEIWWEVWVRRDDFQNDLYEDSDVISILLEEGVQIGERRLVFPEYVVRIVKTTAEILSTTLLYSDKLAELRKPKEAAHFFTGLEQQDANDWVLDLKNRTVNNVTEDCVLISILDTGINRGHPLIEDFLPEENMDSVNPEWGTADTMRHGHGTQMAGICLYGDLTDVLQDTSQVEIYYNLESIKLIHPNNPHDPELYGAVTEEAFARAITLNPQNKRILLMAVTAVDGRDRGKPSSWSSAVDKICFGENGLSEDKVLFCVSGGNVEVYNIDDYPTKNLEESIHDPAQAFNALTVGAYTEKTFIDQEEFQGGEPLASSGDMSPSNSTSISWDNIWAIKPEIVLEGGNLGSLNNGIIDPDSLRLLSTGKNFRSEPLCSFGDTSAASGLATRYASMLSNQYPSLWAETIKGLLIHSAYWSQEMLGNRRIEELSRGEKIYLLRQVGYGIPNYIKASKSANNSLTLIAEESFVPFQLEESTVKTNDMHLFTMPWPVEALSGLFDSEVSLTVTLSYYIEPNPGNKQYSKSYYYQSHGLRFKMIDSNETIDHFKERVNKEARSEDNNESYSGESWIIGSRLRDKGTIHKDIWKGTGADLSTRNVIAVYPVNGWWRTRKKLSRYNHAVRYSLIISIESSDVDVDLYTPIMNLIDIQV